MTCFPGDEVLPDAALVIDPTRRLSAAPSAVWPWIVQLGKNRAGWYLPIAVERLLPERFRAARQIDSRWQYLSSGDRVPDYGGRDEWLEVVTIHAPAALVYRSERGGTTFTWALLLTGEPDGSTIHLRFRGALHSRGWRRQCVIAFANLADWCTAAPMLIGLSERLSS